MPKIETVQDESLPMTPEQFAEEIKRTIDNFAKQMKEYNPEEHARWSMMKELPKNLTFAQWLGLYRRWLCF